MPQIIIRRGKDGMEYGIDSADFKRGRHFQNDKGDFVSFEAAGFEIVSYGDGTEYHAPEPRRSVPDPEPEPEKPAP